MRTYIKFNPNKLKYYYKISKMFTLKDFDDSVVVLEADGHSQYYDFGLYTTDNESEFYKLFQQDYSSFFNAIVKPTLK